MTGSDFGAIRQKSPLEQSGSRQGEGVQHGRQDDQRAAIVRAVLLLGASLNMPVLTEGVETESELGFLRDHNCNSVQGFLYSKPLTAAELHDWMGRQKADLAS